MDFPPSSLGITAQLRDAFLAPPQPPQSLFWALLRVQRATLLCSALFYVLQVVCALSQPVAIFYLLQWITADPSSSAWTGTVCVLSLAVASICGFVAENQFNARAKAAGIRARAAVSGLVFEKLLRVTLAHGGSSIGEATSLFGAESLSLLDFYTGIITLAIQPIEVVGILLLLYWVVDLGALGGAAAVLLAVCLMQAGSRQNARILAASQAVADIRLRDTTEILLGMKAVKLNVLERQFYAAIAGSRERERQLAASTRWNYGFINTSASNAVDVISIGVLLVYALGEGLQVTAEIVFTYWVLLGLLHGRIFHLPVAMRHTMHGLHTLARIEALLRGEEPPDMRELRGEGGAGGFSHTPSPDDDVVVQLTRASFAWLPTTTAPLLTDLNLCIRRGELCAVIGLVGAAKSSLLLGLLGEMRHLGGRVVLRPHPPSPALTSVSGSTSSPDHYDAAASARTCADSGVAYVPQQAWIIPGATIREQIVFGRSWDAERYRRVVSSCALDADFDAWGEARDLITASSFTLSGGQRQRISLARAAYSDPATTGLYLLDDCLSALDQRVARHVMEHCICGLLAGTTRVLVTHSAGVLSACEFVGVCLPAEAIVRGAGSLKTLSRSAALSSRYALVSQRLLERRTAALEGAGEGASPSSPSSSSAEDDAALPHRGRHGSIAASPSNSAGTTSGSPLLARQQPGLEDEPFSKQAGAAAAAALPPSLTTGGAVGGSVQRQAGPFSLIFGKKEYVLGLPIVQELLAQLISDSTADGATEASAGPVFSTPSNVAPHAGNRRCPAAAPQALPCPPATFTESPAAAAEGGAAAEEPPPSPLLSAFTPSMSAAAPPAPTSAPAVASLVQQRTPLPVLVSWLLSVGGVLPATGLLLLLSAEATSVMFGVYWLSWWSEDSAHYQRWSFSTYFWVYGLLVAVELTAAYFRQVLYVLATSSSAATLHNALLFRLTHAPQSFFDGCSSGALMSWFGRDLSLLDEATFYASEYFWLGLVYGALIVFTELAVTPWVLLPGAVAGAMLVHLVAAQGAAGEAGGESAAPSASAEAVRRSSNEEGGEGLNPAAAARSPRSPGTSGSASRADLSTPVYSSSPPAPSPPRGACSLLSRGCARNRGARLPDLQRAEHAAKVPVLEHFSSALEGVVSLRAFGARSTAGFMRTHHALMDAHSLAWARLTQAESRQVLQGNLIGSFYYVTSVAMILPMAILGGAGGAGISAGAAGFIIVNSCFMSYMVVMTVENFSALSSLALVRGSILRAIMEMPQEEEGALLPPLQQQQQKLASLKSGAQPVPLVRAAEGVRGDSSDHLPHTLAAAADAAYSRAILSHFAPYYRYLQTGSRGHPPVSPDGPAVPLAEVVVAPTAGRCAGSGDGPSRYLQPPTTRPPVVDPPAGWPSAGHVIVSNLSLRYSPEGPLVLRGVSLEAVPGSRIAIVGRTGSGKSSLISALVRLVEPCGGSCITVDGVDTATLPLSAVRSGIAVISQEPLFFSGSLRRNLDPFETHSEAELLAALRQVHLFEFAAAAAAQQAAGGSQQRGYPDGVPVTPGAPSLPNHPGPLDFIVHERGGNLSLGQQQLCSVARALLRKPRVALLDECTASVDAETEMMISDTLSESFCGATLIIVAHRLASVIDVDHVVVLDAGAVVEQGAPWELLRHHFCKDGGGDFTYPVLPQPDPGAGVFASMVAALPTSQQEALLGRARQAYQLQHQ